MGEAFDIAQKQGFSDSELKHLQSDLNEIMQSAGKAEELYQEGINYKNDAELIESINEVVSKLEKHQKTAIICKTRFEAEELAKKLQGTALKEFTPVFDEKITSPFFENNKIITTAFLSKGLEFDNVIIYNANKENFKTETDRQILCVMITRALHTVTLLNN